MDGAHAMGLSGEDGRAAPAHQALLHRSWPRSRVQVGEITSVNADVLEMLLGRGFVPVISPIGLGDDGQSYNINADAGRLRVYRHRGEGPTAHLPDRCGRRAREWRLAVAGADRRGVLHRHLAAGGITGGMREKTEAALKALAAGVASGST